MFEIPRTLRIQQLPRNTNRKCPVKTGRYMLFPAGIDVI